MNSNRAFHVTAGLLGVAMALLTQLPWQRRLQTLESQVGDLRAKLEATQLQLASLKSTDPANQQIARLETPALAQGPAAVPQLQPQRPSRSWKALPELVNHAARPSSLDELALLSEQELDETVAGAGVPPPGPLAITGPAPEGEGEQTANRLVPRVDKGGVLLPKGKLQIEPSITYTHVSNNRVALSGFSVFDVVFIGEIRSDDVNRDIITPALNARYGLAKNLQAEMDLPTQYRHEETLSGPIDNRTAGSSADSGFGDMSGGLYYQFAHQDGMRPNMIALMKLKAPTGRAPLGSEAWGLKGGLVMVKNSDPVVLFSNFGYTLNFPGDVNGLRVDQGDAFEYSAGLAYALNYNLALNGSFEQIFIGQTRAAGSSVTGSRLVVANFKTGLTYAFTKSLSMDVSVGTGLTEDSPDLSVSLSFPYSF